VVKISLCSLSFQSIRKKQKKKTKKKKEKKKKEEEEKCWYSFSIADVSLCDLPKPLLLLKSEKKHCVEGCRQSYSDA